MKSIVFYDSVCGLCQRSVMFFLKADTKKVFLFAPLNGVTAKKELKAWQEENPNVDSIVFLEEKKGKKSVSVYSQAIFSMLWKLGGIYKVLGVFSLFPSWFLKPADWVYRFIAGHRKEVCELKKAEALFKDHREQFLP